MMLNVIRKTTNNTFKKNGVRRSAAARTRLAKALTEKFAEKRAGFLPVFPVDAIFYFWSLHFALYEPGLFQLFQVLRYRSFGNGQFFVYVAEVATRLLGQKAHDGNPGGVSQSFGKAGQLFLTACECSILFHFRLFVVCKITNSKCAFQIILLFF